MKNEKKIEKKTIMAAVLGVMALGVVLFQMKGLFMPSGSAGVSTTPPAATTQAAPTLPLATSSGDASARNAYSKYIAQVDESKLVFDAKKFKNPMTALITKDDEDEDEKSKPSGPATKVVAVETEATAAGYSIEGIVWHEKDPLALINDQVVGIGENLEDGAVVTEITRDTVRFRINGNRYYLVLREE
jgi:hypothetical protein